MSDKSKVIEKCIMLWTQSNVNIFADNKGIIIVCTIQKLVIKRSINKWWFLHFNQVLVSINRRFELFIHYACLYEL